jgi:uncharacterized protein YndB with AHSA1/START domain
MTSDHAVNPELDLVLERIIDVPRDLVWKAWTTPEQLMQWFTPAPWKTIACEIDLRPGGRCFTIMQSPEGEEFPNEGCYLEVVENQRLVWTSVLGAGYRPIGGDLPFTAVISLEDSGTGTKYTATAIHGDAALAKQHDEMGFHVGWGLALDQLVAMIKAR